MARNTDADQAATCARCHADLPAAAAFCPRCGASTTPGRAAGPVLAGYTILRTLGHGGAADVYLAQQESLDRQVAVKVIRSHVDDPKLWRHFSREARTIARLSGHPNVVTVYTAGRSEAGEPYLVTEYLDRGSLGDAIEAEGPLPPAVVASMGVAVADALSAAHGLGIHHRDVKPGNVLLGHDGRVKLGDFGIARLLAGQSLTTTDVVAFTPEHVAPEVLRGEPDGPWSDLYGLASTLTAALVGASLFAPRPDERVEAMLMRKLMAPPPVLPASVPAALAAPITAALDPDPTRRPSLTEFRAQLAAAADELGASVPLSPPTPAPVAASAGVTAAMPVLVGDDHDDGGRRSPLLGPLSRPRFRPLAIPVLLGTFLALVAAAVTVAALTRGGDDGDASSATNPLVTSSTPGSTGQPTAPAPAPVPVPASSTAVATTAPAVTPVSTAAPTTDPPPPATTVATTAAPATTTSPPPETTTSPPPTLPPPAEPAVITAPQAETFVRSYYDAVAAGNYEVSWAQLAPEFQQGLAVSYEYYVGFWDDNDVEVGGVELVEATEEQAIVRVELRWNDNSDADLAEFTLRPGENGELLIASQNNVG